MNQRKSKFNSMAVTTTNTHMPPYYVVNVQLLHNVAYS